MKNEYFKLIYSVCCRILGESKCYFKYKDGFNNLYFNSFISELVFRYVANGEFAEFERFFCEHFETVSFKERTDNDTVKVINVGEVHPAASNNLMPSLFCQSGVWQKIVDEVFGTDFQQIAKFNESLSSKSNIKYFRLNFESEDNTNKYPSLIFKNKDGVIREGDPFFDLIFHCISNKDFADTQQFLLELGFEVVEENNIDSEYSIEDFWISYDRCTPFVGM